MTISLLSCEWVHLVFLVACCNMQEQVLKGNIDDKRGISRKGIMVGEGGDLVSDIRLQDRFT